MKQLKFQDIKEVFISNTKDEDKIQEYSENKFGKEDIS